MNGTEVVRGFRVDHGGLSIAQGEPLGWGLLGGWKAVIVNCASARTSCFMRQSEVAESYGLQMAKFPVLCLLWLEGGKERVGSRCGELRHTLGMSHGRSRRALRPASGIVRSRSKAAATICSHWKKYVQSGRIV